MLDCVCSVIETSSAVLSASSLSSCLDDVWLSGLASDIFGDCVAFEYVGKLSPPVPGCTSVGISSGTSAVVSADLAVDGVFGDVIVFVLVYEDCDFCCFVFVDETLTKLFAVPSETTLV